MASSRLFSQQSLKYGFAAFAAASATLSTMPTAHAQSRKSIYDDDDNDTEAIAPVAGTIRPAAPTAKELALTKTEIVNGVTVRTADNLEKIINKGRNWVAGKAEQGQQKADNVFEKYLNAEKSVTSTIAEIKSDEEDILPGGIYVLVSTLTGSILARNRNIALRGIAPVVFGVAAFRYFLPQTYENTGKLIWKFEQKAPSLADTHVKTKQQVDGLVKDVTDAVDSGNQALENAVHSARKFVADSTGLQIPTDQQSKKN